MVKKKAPSQKKQRAVPAKIERANALAKEYAATLAELKHRIQEARVRAVIAVNKELSSLYWDIGNAIHQKQQREKWGAKIIENFSSDLKAIFPGMKGLSLTNLKYMVQFAKEYQGSPIGQQPVGQIGWGHNILLLQRLSGIEERLWYANKTIENGWSRNVLLHWLDSDLFHRQGKAISNFHLTLPSPQTDLVQQMTKDPYILDFIFLREKHDEKELEAALVEQIQRFLLELGTGFSFVGRQYRLEISGKEYLIDLLFYHFKLRRFIVVELKAREFDPRDTGQINFYLSAIDDLLKHPDDESTIGLLLCKTKDNITVEYALRNTRRPITVSGYETQLVEALPKNLKGSLPTIEEIEAELRK